MTEPISEVSKVRRTMVKVLDKHPDAVISSAYNLRRRQTNRWDRAVVNQFLQEIDRQELRAAFSAVLHTLPQNGDLVTSLLRLAGELVEEFDRRGCIA